MAAHSKGWKSFHICHPAYSLLLPRNRSYCRVERRRRGNGEPAQNGGGGIPCWQRAYRGTTLGVRDSLGFWPSSATSLSCHFLCRITEGQCRSQWWLSLCMALTQGRAFLSMLRCQLPGIQLSLFTYPTRVYSTPTMCRHRPWPEGAHWLVGNEKINTLTKK